MLKLLKYEIIGSYRQYLLTYGIFILLCLITAILPSTFKGIFTGILMVAVFVIILSMFYNIIVSFNRSMFSRPGYLTMTLPVKTSQIVLSKLIGAMIWMLVASFVLVIGVMILIFMIGEISFDTILESIKVLFSALGNDLGYTLSRLFTSITSILVMIASFYFTVTFVQTKYVPKYKVIVGIVGYFLGSMLLSVVVSNPVISNFIIGLDLNSFFFFENLISIIGIVLFYFGTVYLIEHKIEVV